MAGGLDTDKRAASRQTETRYAGEVCTTFTTGAKTQIFRQPCPGKSARIPDCDEILLTPRREIITVQAGQCGNSSQ